MHQPEPCRGNIYGWLVEHAVDLGSSEEPSTHWLGVDRTENPRLRRPRVGRAPLSAPHSRGTRQVQTRREPR